MVDYNYNSSADVTSNEEKDDDVETSRAIITDNVPLPEWIRTMKLSCLTTRLESIQELRPGDHILHSTDFGLGTFHHAIVIGVLPEESMATVVHMNPPPGSVSQGISAWLDNEVRVREDRVDLRKFFGDGSVHRVDYYHPERCFADCDVIARALAKVGKRRVSKSVADCYKLLENNCEHFATWCKTGHAFSIQTGHVQVKDDDDDESVVPENL